MSQKIGTHNGNFHCDEALACYLLKQHSIFRNHEIIRSRDHSILDVCDIVVDVGTIYDHNKKRYDHHQRSFNETMNSLLRKPWKIKLSSAGLVYAHYGKDILEAKCKSYDSSIPLDTLFDKIYENFIIEIDAIDNGISVCDEEPKYSISTNLSKRVGYLNPWWNSQDVDENEQFKKAMELVGSEFNDRVEYYLNCWWPARKFVQDALDSRYEVHKSGRILKLNNGGLPWKMHLFELEKELFGDNGDNSQSNILFVLYEDKGKWRIQCVSVSEGSFTNRLGLLEKWRGYRDGELSSIVGITDGIFVHASGFIGGAVSYESVLKMAEMTIDQALQ